jgi:hypothetical protein
LTACLYALFLRVQRKLTSSEAASERLPFLSPLCCWSRKRDFPVLLAKSGRFGKSYPFRGVYTPLRGTPPNRFPAFAALLGSVKWQKQIKTFFIFCSQKK